MENEGVGVLMESDYTYGWNDCEKAIVKFFEEVAAKVGPGGHVFSRLARHIRQEKWWTSPTTFKLEDPWCPCGPDLTCPWHAREVERKGNL